MVEPFYAPNRKVAIVRQPRPGERLWAVRKSGVTMSVELRDHGEVGTEFQILRGGEVIHGRRFEMRALAMLEADACREVFHAQGWTDES
jgi:hypothetical protein